MSFQIKLLCKLQNFSLKDMTSRILQTQLNPLIFLSSYLSLNDSTYLLLSNKILVEILSIKNVFLENSLFATD